MRFTIWVNVIGACWLVTAFLGNALCACADDGVELFEQRIRPVLVDRCYSCHAMHKMYGLDQGATKDYGGQCLCWPGGW